MFDLVSKFPANRAYHDTQYQLTRSSPDKGFWTMINTKWKHRLKFYEFIKVINSLCKWKQIINNNQNLTSSKVFWNYTGRIKLYKNMVFYE